MLAPSILRNKSSISPRLSLPIVTIDVVGLVCQGELKRLVDFVAQTALPDLHADYSLTSPLHLVQDGENRPRVRSESIWSCAD